METEAHGIMVGLSGGRHVRCWCGWEGLRGSINRHIAEAMPEDRTDRAEMTDDERAMWAECDRYKRDDATDLPIPFVKGFERGWRAARVLVGQQGRSFRVAVNPQSGELTVTQTGGEPLALSFEGDRPVIPEPVEVTEGAVEQLREALTFYAERGYYFNPRSTRHERVFMGPGHLEQTGYIDGL